jgi:alkylhydroperoxidase domain protein
MSETVLSPPNLDRPAVFTMDEIGWAPWLAPMDAADLTDRHWTALVDRARATSPYFMLLARDPAILEARTKTDKDIFYNPEAGLPRAERELSALAASRFNGCIFCASVHARFAAHHAKRREDVQRILDEGVGADIDERWNAILEASVALSSTPPSLGPEHVARLRDVGFDDLAIADVIHGAAFFNWANRLMLSLGEPQGARG